MDLPIRKCLATGRMIISIPEAAMKASMQRSTEVANDLFDSGWRIIGHGKTWRVHHFKDLDRRRS